MKKILALSFILLTSPVTLAGLKFYGGINAGNYWLNETTGGNNYKHESSFMGHLGFAFGGKYLIQLGPIGLGIIGELGWQGNSVDRRQTGSTSSAWYRNEMNHFLYGASIHLGSEKVALIGEYYPSVQNTISYSDAGGANPWRTNDILRGTGYGIGISYAFWSTPAYVMYRRLSYKDVQMAGAAVTLPSSRYTTEFLIEDMLMGAIISF